jgi:hypothetical protein
MGRLAKMSIQICTFIEADTLKSGIYKLSTGVRYKNMTLIPRLVNFIHLEDAGRDLPETAL